MARNRHGSGPQCGRYSFRHPFCLQHTKEKLGVEIRPSGIHGCGLFALRTFKKGDVIVPYTGDPSSRAFMLQTQHSKKHHHYMECRWVFSVRTTGYGCRSFH